MGKGKRDPARFTNQISPIAALMIERPVERVSGMRVSQIYSVNGTSQDGQDLNGEAYCEGVGKGSVVLLGRLGGGKIWRARDIRLDSIEFDGSIYDIGDKVRIVQHDIMVSKWFRSYDKILSRKGIN